MSQIITFLKQNNAMAIAIGLIMSQNVSKFVNSFTGNMIMPTVNPILDSLGNSYGVKDMEIKTGPFNFKLGNFIESIIELLIITMVVMWFANYAK